jgi:hypothetical protein
MLSEDVYASGENMMSRSLNAAAAALMFLAFALPAIIAANAETNRAPLKPQPFARLPLGSVQAKHWLRHQLELQRDGLTGHAEKLYGDIGESDWIADHKRGGQHAWERGPYYAKGLIALAYVLDDQQLKTKSQKWIDRVIQSQREDGDFGPKPRNWWPNMIVLHYMRDYYEATGDERVPPFLEKYFRFQLETLPTHPLPKESGWAKARGGDNLEIVLWLYNRTGEQWLLDLARLLIEQTNEWHKYYADGTGDNWYPNHIVNIMQGLKTPPLMYLVTADMAHKNGFAHATKADGWVTKKCGRVDGMVSGTEPLTDRGSTQGTELCAIVERILATTVAMKILGDAEIGDQLERVAYNALPAALLHDLKGMRYYILPNQPKCTNEKLGFAHNGSGRNAICPSPHSGYACCRSNFHYGWPKFVHNMWMATADNGLAVAAYGPNIVTAKVGKDGTTVTIDQETDYPFREASTLTISTARSVAFPLALRIPGWCNHPVVLVDGKPQANVKPGTFHRVERTWQDGDQVEVRFPMNAKISRQINDSVAVTRGPLVFSLLIEEDSKSTRSFLDDRFHTHEIRPASAWNYALLPGDMENPAIETTVANSIPSQPFRAAEAPIRLQLKAVKCDQDGWGTYRKDVPARAVEPPPSPVNAAGEAQDVVLVPYSSTEIRITYFPWADSRKK